MIRTTCPGGAEAWRGQWDEEFLVVANHWLLREGFTKKIHGDTCAPGLDPLGRARQTGHCWGPVQGTGDSLVTSVLGEARVGCGGGRGQARSLWGPFPVGHNPGAPFLCVDVLTSKNT